MSVALTVDDLPGGFENVKTELSNLDDRTFTVTVDFQMGGNSTQFSRENPTYSGVIYVSNVVERANSIDEAFAIYKMGKNKFNGSDTVAIGDESFITYISKKDVDTCFVGFRKKNIISIIGIISMREDCESEAIRFAEIVEGRITKSME